MNPYLLLLILLLLVLSYFRLKRPKRIWSKQSGSFFSPSTWVGGKVPGEHDDGLVPGRQESVGIRKGHTVTFDRYDEKEEND